MIKTEFNFTKDILGRSKEIPVLVELSAPGCGPCVWMEKTLVNVTRKMNGRFEFVSLPITEHPELAQQYDLKSNPTTILFMGGKEAGRLNGALPDFVVEQWINDHIK